MTDTAFCVVCSKPFPTALLEEAQWYPFWQRADGACPGCVQQNLLKTLLDHGEARLQDEVQVA